MATIKWTKKAERIFFERVEEAFIKFGLSTAKKWQKERMRKTEKKPSDKKYSTDNQYKEK